jgi:hypothetical protein
MPQDKGRCRVAAAPDGRGMPEKHKPRPGHGPQAPTIGGHLLGITQSDR